MHFTTREPIYLTSKLPRQLALDDYSQKYVSPFPIKLYFLLLQWLQDLKRHRFKEKNKCASPPFSFYPVITKPSDMLICSQVSDGNSWRESNRIPNQNNSTKKEVYCSLTIYICYDQDFLLVMLPLSCLHFKIGFLVVVPYLTGENFSPSRVEQTLGSNRLILSRGPIP